MDFNVTLVERGRIRHIYVTAQDGDDALRMAKAEARKLKYQVSDWLSINLA